MVDFLIFELGLKNDVTEWACEYQAIMPDNLNLLILQSLGRTD